MSAVGEGEVAAATPGDLPALAAADKTMIVCAFEVTFFIDDKWCDRRGHAEARGRVVVESGRPDDRAGGQLAHL